jgi:hypothetical protein
MLMVSVSGGPSPEYRAHTFECMRCAYRVTARVECSSAFSFEDEAAALAAARSLAVEMGYLDLASGSLIVSDRAGKILGEFPIVKSSSKRN